jgi:hypothetical protein
MSEDIELLKAARSLIEQFGKTAADQARKRAENSSLGGSMSAAHQWELIAKKIEAMGR